MATWEDVRTITAALPETVERAPREWRARDKNLAWERPLRKADYAALGDAAPDGDILGVRVADVGVAEALCADDPVVYFRTPHFAGYPAVLVRLGVIEPDELRQLLVDAWLARVPKRMAQAYLDAHP
ncbi:MmcQ/YjbR family DNA-binding protein [Krasilnikovia sp. M28-CT-15]|uniref:MmcQ/YjbR family DNA-binding protein n=1 Tax=Krasilnikovia sp. M28-CT-15 TaxID=3373540 RepID=UPI0038766926